MPLSVAVATLLLLAVVAASTSTSGGVYVLLNCLGGGNHTSEIWFYPDTFFDNKAVNDKHALTPGSWVTWEGQTQSTSIEEDRCEVHARIDANGRRRRTWHYAGTLQARHGAATSSVVDHACSRVDNYVYLESNESQCMRLYACSEK